RLARRRRDYRSPRLFSALCGCLGNAPGGGRDPEVDGLEPVSQIREYLALAGKRGPKLIAVSCVSPWRCGGAVPHVRRGAPDAPVWLFCAASPDPETARLCERILVSDEALSLVVVAEKALGPHWVALAVSTWTGEHGRWPLKIAP